MLNLSRQEQALTQGQSSGQRVVVARAVHIDEMTSTVTVAPSTGPTQPIDPQVIARIILDMMRQELRIERERNRRSYDRRLRLGK